MNVIETARAALDGKELRHPGMPKGKKIRWCCEGRGRFQIFEPAAGIWVGCTSLSKRDDWYVIEPETGSLASGVERAELDWWQHHAERLDKALLDVLECLDGKGYAIDMGAVEAAPARAVERIKRLEAELKRVQNNYGNMARHLTAFMQAKHRSRSERLTYPIWENVTRYAEKLEAELEELRKPVEVKQGDEELEVWMVEEIDGDLYITDPKTTGARTALYVIEGDPRFRGYHFEGCDKVMPGPVAWQSKGGRFYIAMGFEADKLVMRDGVYMAKEREGEDAPVSD